MDAVPRSLHASCQRLLCGEQVVAVQESNTLKPSEFAVINPSTCNFSTASLHDTTWEAPRGRPTYTDTADEDPDLHSISMKFPAAIKLHSTQQAR
jgi:hypothetical protein